MIILAREAGACVLAISCCELWGGHGDSWGAWLWLGGAAPKSKWLGRQGRVSQRRRGGSQGIGFCWRRLSAVPWHRRPALGHRSRVASTPPSNPLVHLEDFTVGQCEGRARDREATEHAEEAGRYTLVFLSVFFVHSSCSGIVHLHNQNGLVAPPHRQVREHSHSLICKLWRHGITGSVKAHRMRRLQKAPKTRRHPRHPKTSQESLDPWGYRCAADHAALPVRKAYLIGTYATSARPMIPRAL